jgi:hypothetical protein
MSAAPIPIIVRSLSTSRSARAANADEVEIADDDLVVDRRVAAAGSLGWHHPAIFGLREMRRAHQPAGFIWMRWVAGAAAAV